MTSQKQWGFTIIELILFLGITGALFAGLMVGVNANIASQRYKESVSSYKSLLEAQYAAVSSPQNERPNDTTCRADGISTVSGGEGDARGTSPCVLLGRYIEIKEGGTRVETGNVVGVEPTDADSINGDVATLKAYNPFVSSLNTQTQEIDWQSILVDTDKKPSTASFLILRSPQSGLIRTFASVQPLTAVLSESINEDSSKLQIKNCVTSSDGAVKPPQSVTVDATVGSANGIVLNGNDDQC